jgi:hypothetical protein
MENVGQPPSAAICYIARECNERELVGDFADSNRSLIAQLRAIHGMAAEAAAPHFPSDVDTSQRPGKINPAVLIWQRPG